MTLADLIPELKALPRTDKLRVIQMMAAEVADEENSEEFREYSIWSQFDAFDGAATLMRALEQEKTIR